MFVCIMQRIELATYLIDNGNCRDYFPRVDPIKILLKS